jgi:hypothetical protein
MRANLGPSVSLDFLDGYLFRLLQEIAGDHGLERSGFENYYGYRLTAKIGGLIEYEESLARHLIERYAGRRIVHAGIGVGTLACALACNGMTVAGVESYAKRVQSARYLREALIEIWPEIETRYEIIAGTFPHALMPSAASAPQPSRFLPWRRRTAKSAVHARPGPAGQWLDSGAILIFTNVVNNWNDRVATAIFEALPRFAEVFLDLRLFGTAREAEEDRADLFHRIAATARSAERLPKLANGCHFARFVYV